MGAVAQKRAAVGRWGPLEAFAVDGRMTFVAACCIALIWNFCLVWPVDTTAVVEVGTAVVVVACRSAEAAEVDVAGVARSSVFERPAVAAVAETAVQSLVVERSTLAVHILELETKLSAAAMVFATPQTDCLTVEPLPPWIEFAITTGSAAVSLEPATEPVIPMGCWV